MSQSETTIHLESISQVHEMIGYAKPEHPLISLIENPREKSMRSSVPLMNVRIVTELYSISLKVGNECGIKYGRQIYDFQEGSMMFLAPHQAVMPVTAPGDMDMEGDSWVLLFHPDLIRQSTLATKIKEYRFFSYESHEALHLSQKERLLANRLVHQIKDEYSQHLDDFSQELITSHLELLLNYCKRFYGRQFVSRSSAHKDIVVRFEAFLRDYFDADDLEHRGLPTVQDCAKVMGYSPNYLSDLLKKETGQSTREHIHSHAIERAKDLLLGTEDTIGQISYALGFAYPQHFSKLFKNKTGISPAQYRQ